MDRNEAARYLGLADTEVLATEETEDGTAVRLRAGGDRLITPDDGVFALTDHPSTAGLRRWRGPDTREMTPAETATPGAQTKSPVEDGPASELSPLKSHPVADATFSEGAALPDNREDLDQAREQEGEEVPDGNADAVLDWVGDDRDRAQRALAAEEGRDHPRSTLISKLRKLAGTES
jgi:hypothetical protein